MEITLTETDMETAIAVFSELRKIPYKKLNTILGNITIKRMCELEEKLRVALLADEDDREELS